MLEIHRVCTRFWKSVTAWVANGIPRNSIPESGLQIRVLHMKLTRQSRYSKWWIFIGRRSTSRILSKTEPSLQFARAWLPNPMQLCKESMRSGADSEMLLSDWSDRHTNIFCLQDSFFQKNKHYFTLLHLVNKRLRVAATPETVNNVIERHRDSGKTTKKSSYVTRSARNFDRILHKHN